MRWLAFAVGGLAFAGTALAVVPRDELPVATLTDSHDQPFSTDDLRDKPLVVISFDSPLAFGVNERVEFLAKLLAAKGKRPIEAFVVVNKIAEAQAKKTFTAQLSAARVPLLFDSSSAFAKAAKVLTLPTTLLVNRRMRVVAVFEGDSLVNRMQLQARVELLRAGKKQRPAHIRADVNLKLPRHETQHRAVRVHVVGEIAADTEMVEMRLNGRRSAALRLERRHLHGETPLVLGTNLVEVIVRNKKSRLLSSAGVVVHRGLGFDDDEEADPWKFHGDAVAQKQCVECHKEVRPTKKPLTDLGPTCQPCHAHLLSRIHVHTPLEDEDCGMCHVAVTEGFDLMESSESVLCFECHDTDEDAFAGKNEHAPFASDSCMACHDPHSGDAEGNLKSSQGEICGPCHDSIEGAQALHTHAPFRDGKCTECHAPHASNHEYMLRTESNELCLRCHQDRMKGHKHPHRTRNKAFLPKTLPRGKDGDIVCYTCHRPHGSANGYLLRGSAGTTCEGCHRNR